MVMELESIDKLHSSEYITSVLSSYDFVASLILSLLKTAYSKNEEQSLIS